LRLIRIQLQSPTPTGFGARIITLASKDVAEDGVCMPVRRGESDGSPEGICGFVNSTQIIEHPASRFEHTHVLGIAGQQPPQYFPGLVGSPFGDERLGTGENRIRVGF